VEQVKKLPLFGRCLAASLAIGACGGAVNDTGVTRLEVRVSTSTPDLVGSIHFTILGAHFNRYGALDVTRSPMMSAYLSDIPVGEGYSLTLVSDDGGGTCAGSGDFDIVEGQSTVVDVVLSCHKAVSKPVVIQGSGNECPDIASVMSSTTPRVGVPTTLTAVATDGDNGPMPLSYTWLADSGELGSPHAAVTTYTCTQPGQATLVLTVSDGDLPCDQLLGVKVDCGCSTRAAADSGVCELPDGSAPH
jgi:hypothetical protein